MTRSTEPAAVLVPVLRDREGGLRLVLVVRAEGGVHGGQIGLPGGKPEPGDGSLLETALREAEEEIGLRRRDVAVVAALEPLDSAATGFRVHPFLARVRGRPRWRLAAGEIVEVLEPRLEALADPASRRRERISLPHGPEPRDVDCVCLDGGRLLWGLTLRLLDALVPRLLAGEWAL